MNEKDGYTQVCAAHSHCVQPMSNERKKTKTTAPTHIHARRQAKHQHVKTHLKVKWLVCRFFEVSNMKLSTTAHIAKNKRLERKRSRRSEVFERLYVNVVVVRCV